MTQTLLWLLYAALAGLSSLFAGGWVRAQKTMSSQASERGLETGWPHWSHLGTGALTNFFDTLGIGAFAPTTALMRGFRMVSDRLIPGTLNVGLTPPAILQAFIFTKLVPVDPWTLVLMVAASTLGAWQGARVVSRWPRRHIQLGMGLALLVASGLMLLSQLALLPAGGEALGLSGGKLALALVGNFVLGALMTLGIGLYAPCMIMLSFLGMSVRSIFPIMMTSCACLMPVGSLPFLKAKAFGPRVSLGLALGGIPAVLVAAFLVKELPLNHLRWVVVFVTLYTGFSLVWASRKRDTPTP